ncbi:hypothetical protein WMY93_020689 [Mugilogobius chulae]|uniref:Mitochondrial fission process protein 1 n=1 Tax=Mugilogobius chulae TaxID=88201 RepID=A0AAW0ND36_9GOBI
MDSTQEKTPKTVDIYRDTWVRFWVRGYANEVGEAFRALVPVSLVWGSYVVATTYVTADARWLLLTRSCGSSSFSHHPGFTINRVCAASLYLLGKTTKLPLPVRKWTTTAIGLSTIPFIITPIDRSVDFLLDSSLRKVYGEGEKHE